MDVVTWLRGLGLEQYEPAFRANEIDWAVLPKLTSEDLREIGVVPIGHRRRMLDAIAVLSNERTIAVATARRQQVDAERRQLTVMFCDLVGSTELSARFDPEDLREVIAAYHRAVAEVVRAFDGFVAGHAPRRGIARSSWSRRNQPLRPPPLPRGGATGPDRPLPTINAPDFPRPLGRTALPARTNA